MEKVSLHFSPLSLRHSSLDLLVHPLPVDVVGGRLARLVVALLAAPPPPPLSPALPLYRLGQLEQLGERGQVVVWIGEMRNVGWMSL